MQTGRVAPKTDHLHLIRPNRCELAHMTPTSGPPGGPPALPAASLRTYLRGMSAARLPGVGAEIAFRRARESDASAIFDLYASLSEESAVMRFFGTMPRATLEAVAGLAGGDDVASVLALRDGRIVGEARYLMHGDGEYEFGIVVADGCQQRGVGRRLLDMLRRDAGAHGIETLRAVVRVDNLAMLRTLRSIGCAIVEPAEGGVLVAELSCVDAMPGWSAASAGRRVLVEADSVWADPASAALRGRGFDVRLCLGPRRGRPQTCPLVLCGRCPLAEGADIVACLLGEDDRSCREVAVHHATHDPKRLAARSVTEWRAVAQGLARP